MSRLSITPLRWLVVLVLSGLVAGAVGMLPADAAPRATATSHPVMGTSAVTATDLAGWYARSGYVSKTTVSVAELARDFIEEGQDEGVAGDLAFAQAMLETGWLGFSTRMPPSNNNFAGLGAVDSGSSSASFPDARTGVRAQIQHLRAYADPTVTVSRLHHPLVDGRFTLVSPKGKAPTWEQMGNGNWATDPDYASKILSLYSSLRAFAAPSPWRPFSNASAFVGQQYVDLLDRRPTAAESEAGVAAVQAGTLDGGRLVETLWLGEGQDTVAPVARLYLSELGRVADPDGLGYWVGKRRSGMRLVAMADAFAASSEFTRRFGAPDDGGFVDLVYRNVLGRSPDASGLSYWVRQLATGTVSRAGMVVRLSESSEHIRTSGPTVDAATLFTSLLRQVPDSATLSGLTTRRRARTSVAALANELLASTDYGARFS